MRTFLREVLEEDGYTVEVASGGRGGVERVRQGGIDLVVSDVKMPDLDGLDMLREIKAVTPSPHVITITAFGSIDTAIRAVKLGAFDYITKPFEIDQLILSVREGAGRARAALGGRAAARRGAEELPLGEHHRTLGVDAGDVRAHPAALGLVDLGAHHRRASGTGKELVAKAIHFNSPRRERPVRGAQLRRRSPTRCSRASCSATSAARSPTPAAIAPASSSRPTAARSSSTRSPSWRPRCRPSSCACCRSARSGRSARHAASTSTCAWSRPPTRISSRVSATAPSARISTTA